VIPYAFDGLWIDQTLNEEGGRFSVLLLWHIYSVFRTALQQLRYVIAETGHITVSCFLGITPRRKPPPIDLATLSGVSAWTESLFG